MSVPQAMISPEENLHEVLKKFDQVHQGNLPVIEENECVGFVSKSRILAKYREELLKTL